MNWISNFLELINSREQSILPLIFLFFLFIILLRNLDLGLYLLIFSIPLSPKITGIFGSEIPIRIDDILIVMLFMVWIMKISKGEAHIYKTPFSALIMSLFIFMVANTVLGYIGKGTIVNIKYSVCVLLKNFEYYAVFFLIASNIHTRRQIKNIITLWMAAYFLVIVYGIAEHLVTHAERLYDGAWWLYDSQSNHMGGYLMISTIIALALSMAANNVKRKISYLVLILLSLYPFFYNQSKQAYLSFTVSLTLIYLFLRPYLLFIPALLILVLFFGIPRLFPHMKETETINFLKLSISKGYDESQDTTVISPDSADIRRRIIKRSFREFSKYPLIGRGTGYRPLAWYDSQVPLLLFENGIIGTAIFVWLLLRLLISGFKNFLVSKDSYFKALSAAFIASYFGVLIHSVAAPAWVITLIIEPFWFFAAIMVIIDRINKKEAALNRSP